MARKKASADLSKLIPSKSEKVQDEISKATSEKGHQATAGPDERAHRLATLRTQGRKGCKSHRINMVFSPANYEFIQVMAMAAGTTMTRIVNKALDTYREEQATTFKAAKKFRAKLNLDGEATETAQEGE